LGNFPEFEVNKEIMLLYFFKLPIPAWRELPGTDSEVRGIGGSRISVKFRAINFKIVPTPLITSTKWSVRGVQKGNLCTIQENSLCHFTQGRQKLGPTTPKSAKHMQNNNKLSHGIGRMPLLFVGSINLKLIDYLYFKWAPLVR
jgi:hypothetical protein